MWSFCLSNRQIQACCPRDEGLGLECTRDHFFENLELGRVSQVLVLVLVVKVSVLVLVVKVSVLVLVLVLVLRVKFLVL